MATTRVVTQSGCNNPLVASGSSAFDTSSSCRGRHVAASQEIRSRDRRAHVGSGQHRPSPQPGVRLPMPGFPGSARQDEEHR